MFAGLFVATPPVATVELLFVCPAPPALPVVFPEPTFLLLPPPDPPAALSPLNEEVPPLPADVDEVAAAPPPPTFTTIAAPGVTA